MDYPIGQATALGRHYSSVWLGVAGRKAGIPRPNLWCELSESPALAGTLMGQPDHKDEAPGSCANFGSLEVECSGEQRCAVHHCRHCMQQMVQLWSDGCA